MEPVITAVICTQNRVALLKKALASLYRQSLSPENFEILVIDNGSTDGTQNYLNKQGRKCRIVRVPEPGLSRARNVALAEAQGKYLAFLDDDAVAHTDWLKFAVQSFKNKKHSPVCVGGPVLPVWAGPKPAWLKGQLLDYLSIVRWNQAPGFLKDKQHLVGANMAFERKAIVGIGGFSESLDRQGELLLSGGDTHAINTLRSRGSKPFYEPKMKVYHHIHKERLTKKWFLKRLYWQGVSHARIEMESERLNLKQRNIKCLLPLKLLSWEVNSLWNPDVSRGFSGGCLASLRMGYITEMLNARMD